MGDMRVDHQEQPPPDPRIVVGVDGSESSLHALERAARYAELTGGALEVFTAWAFPVTYGWSPQIPADWNPLADVTKALDKVVDQLRQAHPDVAVHPRVAEGHAAPLLIEASRGAELLVVGSRGHGEFTGMLLGSVGAHCVSHAHCPVLVVRGDG
jgi:nucleotide-binding universal stress UspA family protein